MTREEIDAFLLNEKDMDQVIRNIAKKYRITDFVKVTKPINESLKGKILSNDNQIYGCLYNERDDYFLLDGDSVEQRLTRQYMELLYDIIFAKEEIDKIFYIISFHYLTLCKQLGYQLTNGHDAPFYFIGKEMSPLAKDNYKKYKEIYNNRLHTLFPYFNEDDLIFYNRAYRECGYHHHSTKHFSLIEYMVGFDKIIGKYEFDCKFEKMLDLFVFRYKAIYSTDRLRPYMFTDEKEKIKKELMDIDE